MSGPLTATALPRSDLPLPCSPGLFAEQVLPELSRGRGRNRPTRSADAHACADSVRGARLRRERAWPACADLGGFDLPEVVADPQRQSLLRINDWPEWPGSLAVNPYRGCPLACPGCPAGHSGSLHAKLSAADSLREELRQPRYQVRPIQLGSAAEAYPPAERQLRLTRAILSLLNTCGHPLILVTRSPGVVRDLDLLSRLAERGLVQVMISLCSLDEARRGRWEPRAAAPAQRLAAMRLLARAGVPVGLFLAPLAADEPDDGWMALLQAARRHGASQLRVRSSAPAADRDEAIAAQARELGLSQAPLSLSTQHFEPGALQLDRPARPRQSSLF